MNAPALAFTTSGGSIHEHLARVRELLEAQPDQPLRSALRGMTSKQLAGPHNGRALRLVLRHARMIVVGWGTPSKDVQRLAKRFVALAAEYRRELYCLGTNAGNHPRHLAARGVSRIPDDAKLVRWTP